jgi:hypothetical protein
MNTATKRHPAQRAVKPAVRTDSAATAPLPFDWPLANEAEHFPFSGAPVSDPAFPSHLAAAGSETGAPACSRFKASVKNPGWPHQVYQAGQLLSKIAIRV